MPAPIHAKNPSRTAAAAEGALPEERDVSGAATLFAALLEQLAPHQPSPEAMEAWRAMISDEQARREGIEVSSARVIAASMSSFAALVPHLLQEPLPGYGPRRACYAVGLAHAHAHAYAAFLETEARRAAASGTKTLGIQEARRERRLLQGILKEATQGDAALQAAVTKASRRGGRTAAQVSASLQGLVGIARELCARGAAQPGLGEALADLGLTEAAVARAEAAARSLGAARSAHDAERTALREESDELNAFDGRLCFELDALRRAADRARSEGRKVPAVRLEALEPAPQRRTSPASPGPSGPTAPMPQAS